MMVKQAMCPTGRVIDHCTYTDMDSHKGFSKYAAFQKMAKHGYDDKEKKDEKKNKSDKETDDTEKIVEFDPEFLYVRVRAVSANVPNNNGDLLEEDEEDVDPEAEGTGDET